MVDAEPDVDATARLSALMTGRLINLRFAKDALYRSRWLWASIAVLGLICGAGYHFVIPVKYAASTTLYLADPPSSDPAVVSTNDLALLQTTAVGERAIKLLREPGLNPVKLLGKAPGVTVSANVMTITIDGPTQREAIRRVNAVASALLAFRSEQYGAQTEAIDAGLNRQIAGLQSQVTKLTNVINGNGPIPSGETLTNVASDRAQDSAGIISLQQTVQQNQLGQLSVATGSRVITPGTVTSGKKIKIFVLDGASGLVAGLGLGIGIVLVAAFTTDRLRRREDIAAVLGAPVDLSIGRAWLPRVRTSGRLLRLAEKPTPPVQSIVSYLHKLLLTAESGQTLLVVAVDDVEVPAVVTAALAGRLTAEGKTVVMADLSGDKVLAHMFGVKREGRHQVHIGDIERVILLVPPGEWSMEDNEPVDSTATQWSNADVVLAVATVDPTVGAWHLLRWATTATLVVTAGRSTAQRINGTAELLRAASIGVTSAILVNADTRDDSIGLSDSMGSPLQQPVGALAQSTSPNWV